MMMLPLAFVNPQDMAIILVLALMIFGPKKLPEIGKQLGQAMREARKVMDEVTGAVHSVGSEVESVYKPVISPPSEYGNPYVGTSSATVEKAAAHRPYDQDAGDLMAPVVPPALKLETVTTETAREDLREGAETKHADVKGH